MREVQIITVKACPDEQQVANTVVRTWITSVPGLGLYFLVVRVKILLHMQHMKYTIYTLYVYIKYVYTVQKHWLYLK